MKRLFIKSLFNEVFYLSTFSAEPWFWILLPYKLIMIQISFFYCNIYYDFCGAISQDAKAVYVAKGIAYHQSLVFSNI